jgi:hypothetical protein
MTKLRLDPASQSSRLKTTTTATLKKTIPAECKHLKTFQLQRRFTSIALSEAQSKLLNQTHSDEGAVDGITSSEIQ